MSPVLRQAQQATLAATVLPATWHDDVAAVPDGPAIFIANEFIDALPLHQVVKLADGWHMRMVSLDGDRLTFALAPDPIPRMEAVLPPAVRDAPFGATYEWRSRDLVAELARRVVRFGGAALLIDYGHHETSVGDTLQAVSRHGFIHPLAAPGETDLTAHVDFAAIRRTAESEGARVAGPIGQGDFLRRLGIEVRAERLKANATPEHAVEVERALARLTTGGDGMGELFKVMAIADPKLGPMPAFEG
jgi:SAM-dependent MidA family methyltransferase